MYTVDMPATVWALLLALAILAGGIFASLITGYLTYKWDMKRSRGGLDVTCMNHNLSVIDGNMNDIKDLVEGLGATVKQLDHEKRMYDNTDHEHLIEYLDTWMGKLHEKVEVENTLLIERFSTRLDKIEVHMALLAVKVPDMNDEPRERKHVNGTTNELPAITLATGIGSSPEGSATPEAGEGGDNDNNTRSGNTQEAKPRKSRPSSTSSSRAKLAGTLS